MNCEIPDVQAGFRKGRGTRDQIANICWIIKKAREFQKSIYFCFIDYAQAFDCASWQEEALARYSVSKDVPGSILKCETVFGTLDATPKVPQHTGLTQGEHRGSRHHFI